ncbi:MAG: hypothetical protein CMM83_04230 [Rhodospirillales bacterium]|nr:hypothetical protein [Rhodospirillales bacterium]|tara:strand:- start:559 stop:792 length:234 start_codon:yes stop_codon:yes gene_type:complete
MGAMAKGILSSIIVLVLFLALTPVIVDAVDDSVTAMGTTYTSSISIIKLVPLIISAGAITISSYLAWTVVKGRKQND